MNAKVLGAFALGALLAGGVAWLVRPTPPTIMHVTLPAPATPTPGVEQATAPPAAAPKAPSAPKAKPARAARHQAPSGDVIRIANTDPAPITTASVNAPTPPMPAPPPEAAPAEPFKARESKILKPDVAAPEKREPRTAVIPAGTMITVRLREALSSEHNSAGDLFHATLDAPLVVDGLVIAERGSMQRGQVTNSAKSGRVQGRASLDVTLTELTTADGQKVGIQTEEFHSEAPSGAKSDAAKAGIAAGIGAAIGAIAGGGKGAAIGGAVGGAAGAGTVLATRGKPAELPSETRVSFRLKDPVTLTEKLN